MQVLVAKFNMVFWVAALYELIFGCFKVTILLIVIFVMSPYLIYTYI